MIYKVFIGVGHGGSDPGAVKYVRESWANLVIGMELKRLLEAAGLIVGISRIRDENDDINEEIREANAFKPDLAVEVHNNAGGGDGFEVYVKTNKFAAQSRACAELVEREVVAIGQQSRGIKTGTFGWIRLIDAPSILTEGFFVDNAKDAAGFDTETELHNLAAAYARGILTYLGVSAPVIDPNRQRIMEKYGLQNNTLDYLATYNSGSILRKLSAGGVAPDTRELAQASYGFSDAEMKYMDGWEWSDALYKKLVEV